jgi:hypothetical protein
MKTFSIGGAGVFNAKTPLTLFGNNNTEEIKREFTPEFKAFMEKQAKEYLTKQHASEELA